MERIVYPIGDSSFEYIRRNGQFYVDKTSYVYDLVSGSKYYFLSRPRRFGKSLLVSTLEAYFSGKRELFEGLELARHETEWKHYPIFHMDFSLGNMIDLPSVEQYFNQKLSEWESIYGSREYETAIPLRFSGLIRRAAQQSGLGVVLLIDEYDNPLFSTFDDKEENDRIRAFFKGIYSVLKSESANVRFCLLTGITRFSKMSVFSGMNNLYDITLLPAYAGICGITQQELEEQCYAGVESVGEANGMTYDETMGVLKEQYDGYHFGDLKLDIYNPFSLIQVFASGEMDSYWFSSGTSEFLWRRLSRFDSADAFQDMLAPVLDKADLGASIDQGLSTEGLLFQTGYLTLKKFLGRNTYQLGIPNLEVKDGIMKGLLPYITGNPERQLMSDITKLRQHADNGEVDKLLELLRSFLASISYRLTKKEPELYYENNLYVILNLIGIETHVEIESSDGRMDVCMKCKDYIYIMELKLDKSAEDAFMQIDEKRYHLPFLRSGQQIIRIGINFSSKTKNIESWKWDKVVG